MNIGIWIFASIIALVAGGLWGFKSAGKSIRTTGAITPARTIGSVAVLITTAILGWIGMMYSIGVLALGLLSDNSNTMPQVAPFVIGFAVFGVVMWTLAGRSCLFLARMLLHSMTQPQPKTRQRKAVR